MVLNTGFCSNGKIQICDSFKTSLSRANRKCDHALCKNHAIIMIMHYVKEFSVSFFACPKTNWWVYLWSLHNSLRSWNFRWKVTIGGTFWHGKNVRALDQLFGKQISHPIPKSLIPFKCLRSSHWEVFY